MAKQYHKNPRQITAKQYEALAIDLAELGDLGGIVHDLNSDEIIGGNQRSRVFDINACDVVLTEELHEPDAQGTVAHGYVLWRGNKYAYRQVRWTPRQCERANIVANKRGGTWDFDILANAFEQDDLLAWGFEPYELGMDETEQAAGGDTEPQIDRAEELREKWQVQPGQLWQLGEHRLICGDCNDAATVARVMGGERAEMVFTSPPYNKGTTTGHGFHSGGMSTQLTGGYVDYKDDLSPDQYRAWQSSLLRSWWELLADDGAIYYNHRPRIQNKLLETALDWNPGLPVRQIVIWNSHAGINFNPACYRGSHEWIVIFAKPDFGLLSRSHSAVGDVWDFGPAVVEGHPAPFPVQMVSRALETTKAQIIYEPFSGSGTTLIACENLRRRCRAVEISPAYVAVALQRWADHTQRTPVLLESA